MVFRGVDQPESLQGRMKLARRTKSELRLAIPFLVDGFDDAGRALFNELPNPAIIVAPNGRVVAKLPWAEAELIGARLVEVDRRANLEKKLPANADMNVLYVHGARALVKGRYQEAARTLRRALSTWVSNKTPFYARAARLRAEALSRSGKSKATPQALKNAETAARSAWQRNPSRLGHELGRLAAVADPENSRRLLRDAATLLDEKHASRAVAVRRRAKSSLTTSK